VSELNLPGPGDSSGLLVLLVVAATVVMATQSQAWDAVKTGILSR
jgi:hypothetical protein